MNTQMLNIRYAPSPQRPPAAWLLTASEPVGWLCAISECRCQQAEVRLRVLPQSLHDRRPLAALVTLGRSAAASGIAYGVVAERLYLPVEARLDPAVTDAELSAMLAPGCEYVWHPRCGLVAFEAQDILPLSKLLALGPAQPASWNSAMPGVALAPRLLSIEPDETPALERVFEESRGDIGSRADDVGTLPRSEAEGTGGPLSSLGAMGVQSLAHFVKFFTGMAPGGATSPTWINSLEQWADDKLGGIARASLAHRFKELHRLMSLLEQNPDEGLKFALPLGGEAHRGVAPPGDRLGRRDVNFNLGAMGGGRAADIWDVPSDLRQRLAARYRDLAMREMRLGRYRRAAYIYAQLLYDLPAAASALATGEHWREAAVLHREKLQRPLDAAKCLEQGGLWSEAIAIYEEVRQYEKAGDLHARLQQHDEARAMYRREIARLRETSDLLSAARVAEFKLELVDDAILLLDDALPRSAQATEAVRALFSLFGRHGRHDEALRRVASVQQAPLAAREATDVVETLAMNVQSYPDREVGHRSADAARVATSRVLDDAAVNDAQRLVAALGRLAPHDRLLQRDGQRYLHGRKAAPPKITSNKSGKIEQIHRHGRVAEQLDVRAATSIGDVVCLVGMRELNLELWRSKWNANSGPSPTTSWRLEPSQKEAPVLLAAGRQTDDRLLIHVLGGDPLPFNPRYVATGGSLHCGGITGVSRRTIAAARSPHGQTTWLAHFNDDEMNIAGYFDDGTIIRDWSVDAHDWQLEEFARGALPPLPPLHLHAKHVYFGLGCCLYFSSSDGNTSSIELPQMAIGIATSLPNTRTRVAVAMVQGGLLFWDDVERGVSMPFASELKHPVIGFTPGGYLIAADEHQVEVYRTSEGKLQFHGQFDTVGQRPIAVLSLTHPNEFSLVSAEGVITTYRVHAAHQ